MHILSFDTSGNELHISLLVDGTPVVERSIAPDGQERQEVASLLMLEIDRAFADAGWKKSQPDLVVVGVGPGSFTGIRVAVITARTICQIFQLPLIGISLLESYYFCLGRNAPAAIVLPSTSNQLFFAAFQQVPGDPAQAVVAPACGQVSSLEIELGAVSTWYGTAQTMAMLPNRSFEPLPKLKNVATAQAQLAFDRLSLSGFSRDSYAWQNVLPLYLRSPSVTLKKNYAAPDPAHDHR